jgi:hypothetical protein
MNIHAGPGVAVREFPVVKPDGKRGSVDYLLYAGGKAIGVVEAKPADHSLGGVEGQALPLPLDRAADPLHQRARPDPKEPERGHLPPARGAAPAGFERGAAPATAPAPGGAGAREALEGAGGGDRSLRAVGRPTPRWGCAGERTWS